MLTAAESERFVDAAESSGFTATSSRGPAFGEVLCAYQSNVICLSFVSLEDLSCFKVGSRMFNVLKYFLLLTRLLADYIDRLETFQKG